ncbi:MAG: beta-ketoacyl-[acyl-carrier-protein] synthase family protein [Burkholderiaceae bacterium]|nr:beta-ketoacyl-[acyl-carrier-protein] synthase family protein [Burkholderiaceae bacterium]
MIPRIRITGYSAITPLGQSLAEFDAHLFNGQSAVRAHPLTLPGLAPMLLPVARCALDEGALHAPSRLPMDRGTAMALTAADAAAASAALVVEPERLGIFWGSGMGGASNFEMTCQTLYGAQRRMRPTTVPTTMPNAAAAELALRFGARGAAITYACACASSAVAIGEAMRAIRAGWIDVAIAGGHEAMLVPGVMASWDAMRVLAPLHNAEQAPSACRPFSADRAGFALGEGGAALVLESEAHARARGAQSTLFMAGYATNCDGMHITVPHAPGQERAMHAALQDAGLSAAEIGYINAHGTATLAGDAAEAQSIATVFGHHTAVSSTKAIHGHLLGGGGAVELVATLRALQAQKVPPTAHLEVADPRFALDLVKGSARHAPQLRFALSNSFAFGGTNAVLIAGRDG